MDLQLRSELVGLNAEADRVHQEHKRKKRALLAETRAKEDALQEWFDNEQRRIEERRNNLILRVTTLNHASIRASASGALIRELEAVTSSSPADTEHSLADAPHTSSQHNRAQFPLLLALDQAQRPEATQHSSHSRSAADPDDSENPGIPAAPACDFTAQPPPTCEYGSLVQDTVHQAISAPVISAAEAPAAASDQAGTEHKQAEDVEIDVSHVIPVAAQRAPGTSTYMLCRPRTKRGKSAPCMTILSVMTAPQ